MIRDFCSTQFLFFLLTGCTAALVNFGSRIFYSYWTNFSIAIIFAYVTGMITAFFLAKFFVFKQSTQKIHRSVFFFFLVNIVGVVQTWAVSLTLAHYFLPKIGMVHFAPEIAHAVGVMVPVFTSYIGHKHWSFR